MDDLTVKYLKHAFFEEGEFELDQSKEFNDVGHSWDDSSLLNSRRRYQKNEGWYWDGENDAEGILWGGCLESIDELLRHGIEIPSISDFKNIILFFETSEEIPSHNYIKRVLRALGERGVLGNINGLLVGRPKAWEFDNQNSDEEKEKYKSDQREAVLEVVRKYNKEIPIVQNLDFGHTAPQICLPSRGNARILSSDKQIYCTF
jgi:muramoyltetrapeptide carboxypeptidase LdcA involved in peptidoglycan recycling